MVYNWRNLLDNWTKEHKTSSKMLIVEAYTNMANTMRYYESEDGRKGGIPFNFALTSLGTRDIAEQIKVNIENWLNYMPKGHSPNWVVRTIIISKGGPFVYFPFHYFL